MDMVADMAVDKVANNVQNQVYKGLTYSKNKVCWAKTI